MRPCPFCAEAIQPAAVVCKHCRRDVPVGASAALTPAAAPTSAPRTSRAGAALVGGLLVAAAGLFAAASNASSTSGTAAASLAAASAAPPPPPAVLAVADVPAVEIPAAAYREWGFTVRDERPCVLTGRVASISGGRRDVKVAVLTDDARTNRGNGLEHVAVFASEQVAAATLSVPLPGPGRYWLVVSNSFSALTAKVVAVEGVTVTCGA